VPRNLSSYLFFSFVIPFYYGFCSGSTKAKSYGFYSSGSATLVNWCDNREQVKYRYKSAGPLQKIPNLSDDTTFIFCPVYLQKLDSKPQPWDPVLSAVKSWGMLVPPATDILILYSEEFTAHLVGQRRRMLYCVSNAPSKQNFH
jgi:hypothetical protein